MKSIETKNLVKRFNGVHAVDQLSVGIEKGTVVGLVGPNGSGKTTLINLLSGMAEIDDGEVIFNEAERRAKISPQHISFFGIARTFQQVRLFEQMTVLDNLLVVVTQRNVFGSLFEEHSEYHRKIAEEMLQKVALWEKRNQLAVHLSYGQRKLLEVARTLAAKAEIYLFDEPFAGLFPEMKKIVSGIVQELKRQEKTVVLVEHDMVLIRDLCDHIFVMDEGKLLAEGKPESVLEQKNVIEAYLGK